MDWLTEAPNLSESELVKEYVKDCQNGDMGVNYHLAQEMERRGLRDPETRDLTPYASRVGYGEELHKLITSLLEQENTAGVDLAEEIIEHMEQEGYIYHAVHS